MESEAGVMRALALAFTLAACSSKGPKDPAFTPAGPKPCEKMADHVVGLMTPKDPVTGKPVDAHRETADKITRVLIDRCTTDKWTQDAQRCWLGLTSFKDVEKCSPLMTIEQRDNFGKAIESAFPRDVDPPKVEPGAGSGAP